MSCPPREGAWPAYPRVRVNPPTGPVAAMPSLVLPADAVVDPRIGAHGPALLALEDGTVFHGIAFGAPVPSGGDLVVNTSQTGYQEVATDPSYAGQMVVMTYPLIGNHGRLTGDDQSERPWLRGLVVGHATAAVLGRARQLVHLLRASGVPAIAGLDTRALARHLRETGCQRAIITAPGEVDVADAVDRAREVPRWEDQDFVGQVSVSAPYESGDRGPLVAVVDYGLKANIIRSLRRRGARVRVGCRTRRRWRTCSRPTWRASCCRRPRDPARPRRPTPCGGDHHRRPTAPGDMPGPPIVARAAGAETRRLRFGHHGANHPIQDLGTGRVQVTAQNHEVTVDGDSVPAGSGFHVSQRNLNDGSAEGLRHATLPIETVQYHPEGSPGPLDAAEVFDRFLEHIRTVA